MGISDHLTCLLRILYASQEAIVRMDMGQLIVQSWERSMTRLFIATLLIILYAEDIMQNPRLDESQAWIKITRRNINNIRYADDTTLMAESEEELKSLLMKVKEESEKVGLKLKKLRSWYLVPSLHGK